MIKGHLILLIIGLVVSCKDSTPGGVIEQEKMQAVLWDVYRAEALAEEIIKKDSGKSAAVESAVLSKKIFLIHKITEEEFRKSYSYYAGRPDIMQAMLDSINARQTRKAALETDILRKNRLPDSVKQ